MPCYVSNSLKLKLFKETKKNLQFVYVLPVEKTICVSFYCFLGARKMVCFLKVSASNKNDHMCMAKWVLERGPVLSKLPVYIICAVWHMILGLTLHICNKLPCKNVILGLRIVITVKFHAVYEISITNPPNKWQQSQHLITCEIQDKENLLPMILRGKNYTTAIEETYGSIARKLYNVPSAPKRARKPMKERCNRLNFYWNPLLNYLPPQFFLESPRLQSLGLMAPEGQKTGFFVIFQKSRCMNKPKFWKLFKT